MPPGLPAQLFSSAGEKRHSREDGIFASESSKAICGGGKLIKTLRIVYPLLTRGGKMVLVHCGTHQSELKEYINTSRVHLAKHFYFLDIVDI